MNGSTCLKIGAVAILLGPALPCQAAPKRARPRAKPAAKPASKQGLNTALIKAADAGDLTAVRALLAKGADPNGKVGPRGDMPLMAEIRADRLPMVQELLARGAKVNVRGGCGGAAIG